MVKNLINEIEQAMLGSLNNEQLAQLRKVLDYTFRNIVVTEKDSVNAESNNQILVENFISAKKVEGCSPNSIAYYRSTINNALIKLGKEVIHITTDDLRHYLNTYQSESGASKVTVDNIRRILSSFFSWLEEENYIVKSPVRRIHKVKVGKTVKETYTDESLELMRDHCSNPRDLALIDLLASTGMRVGELVKLNRSDIDYHNRECIVTGKGDKQRKVYFDARTKIHLQKYINSRTDNNEALFVSLLAPYDRLQISGVEIRLRQMGKDLNIPKVHPHKFRRTLATMAIDKGMPIEQVQHLLGHQSLDTTLQYAMVNQNNVKLSHHKSLVSMSQFIEMFGNQNTNDKGWTESLVKDEFKLSMGKTPARNNPECWDNGTHKWVSISDMSSYTRYTGDTSEYITDYAIADSGIKAVPKGTIIMSFKLSIGRTAITSEDLYTNEAIMAFAGFDEKKFNIDFLHFLIANKNWLLGAKQAVKGQTLNKESIGNAKIIIPPIEAQEEFASIYNQADKSEFVGCKSQFIEMFKEKGYPLRMLKSFADVSTGGTPSKANLEYWNGDKPWVSAEDMKNKYVYDTCEKVTEAGYATCKIIPVDTLMYVCRGSIGVMAINKIECATNQSICRAKCHDNVCNVEFLYHALMYQKDNIKKMGTGTSFKSLNQTSFSELKIELPPYNEQMKFVSIAQQADKSEYYN